MSADSLVAACFIIGDCLDRRGIKNEFRAIDPEVRLGIVLDWSAIIDASMGRVVDRSGDRELLIATKQRLEEL